MGAVGRELPLARDRVGHGAAVVVELDHHEADRRIELEAWINEQRDVMDIG